jgi:hypothetical protein
LSPKKALVAYGPHCRRRHIGRSPELGDANGQIRAFTAPRLDLDLQDRVWPHLNVTLSHSPIRAARLPDPYRVVAWR